MIVIPGNHIDAATKTNKTGWHKLSQYADSWVCYHWLQDHCYFDLTKQNNGHLTLTRRTKNLWYGGALQLQWSYCATTEFVQFLVRFCVPCSSSVYRTPGKKAAVPICKVLIRPGWESNSRPTSTEVDALTTRPRSGPNKELNMALRAKEQDDDTPLPAFKGMRLINRLNDVVWAGE